VGVAVGDGLRGHEAALLAQGGDDVGAGFPDVLPTKQGQLGGIDAVALHGVQNLIDCHAVRDAGVEVVHAIGGRGMHEARAVGIAHILGQIQGRGAFVAVCVGAAVQIMQRVAEHLAAQSLSFGCGQDLALKLVARKTFFNQIGAEQQDALGCVHQGVVQLRVGVERLVGGNRPSGGRPDDGVGFFACGQMGKAKRLSQRLRVIRLKGYIQGVAFLFGVFDLEFGQRRAAIEAPVNGL
jgi:hypothetical protein